MASMDNAAIGEESGRKARAVTRLAAFLVAVLAGLHLVYQARVTGQSPVWAHAMADLQAALGLPADGTAGVVGVVFAVVTALLAVALWSKASRLAALALVLGFGWEVYFRGQEVVAAIGRPEPIDAATRFGAGVAMIGFAVSLAALAAALVYAAVRRRIRKTALPKRTRSQAARRLGLEMLPLAAILPGIA